MLRSIVISLLALLTLPALAHSFAEEPEVDQAGAFIHYGPGKPMGEGRVRTWVRVDSFNQPTALGLVFFASALDGLPHHEMGTYSLDLPMAVAPYDHVEVNWEPMGHEPDGIYTRPHFDFHFYLLSRAARAAITCLGDDLAKCEKRPEAAFAPRDYVWTPGGVPQMGAHWIDPTSPEWTGQTFTQTFIYGFYDGEVAFLEPMITREYLLTHPQTILPVKQAKDYHKLGFYPRYYRLSYSSVLDTYSISLTHLRWVR